MERGYSTCVVTPNRPKRVDGPRQGTSRATVNSSIPAAAPSSAPITRRRTTPGKSSGRSLRTRFPKNTNIETEDEDEHASSENESEGSSANDIQEDSGDEEYEGRTTVQRGKALPGVSLPRLVCILQDYASYLANLF